MNQPMQMMSASISFIDPMMTIPITSYTTPNMTPYTMPYMPNMILPNMTPINLLSDIMQSSNNTLMPINFSQNSQLMSSRNNLQNNLMNNSENFLYIVYEF